MKFRRSSTGGRRGLNTWLKLLLGLVSLLLLFLFTRSRSLQLNKNQKTILDKLKDGGFSQRLALYWVAVSMFESDDYKSNVFKMSNNAFGMKIPQFRDSSRSGTYGDYSAYENIEESARDILLYCEALGYPNDIASAAALCALMKSKAYFEDDLSVYTAGVESKLSKIL